MKKRKFSIIFKNLKPHNPMRGVKKTGGGKHIISEKSLRQRSKKQIKNCLSDNNFINDKKAL